MSIIGIVCVDRNFGIGKNNGLLFRLKEDMRFFKNTTADSIVFCGRKTLESFPNSKPLKGRSTIVLCSPEYTRDDCYCVHSFEDAIKLVKELSKTQPVYIIGGAQIYAAFLPYYDKVYVTKVDADGGAEVFFPNLDENPDFESNLMSDVVIDNGYSTQFCTYMRKL